MCLVRRYDHDPEAKDEGGNTMHGGYVGKWLRVDLGTSKVSSFSFDDATLEKYIGGRGLGAKLLYDELPPNTDPLSPANVLALTTGVLTGTLSPFSSRTNITTKSPLTGLICMGNSGGFFGPELKFAGIDGLLITGRAERMSYLWIQDGKAEIRECEGMRGLTAPEVESRLIGLTDPKSQVLCTGPAADRLVRTACVYGDERFIGRGGTGAVFASKNLKGIVARGSGKGRVPVFDDASFKEIVKQEHELFQKNEFFQLWRQYGTPFIVSPMSDLGIMGTKNYQEGYFAAQEKINGNTLKDTYVTKKITCHRCPVTCISLSEVKEGQYAGSHCRGPEYETLYAFGSDCGVSSLPAIIHADQLCTEYGMDTISTGNTCAFAMELFERGILDTKDTGGLQLTFGNHEAMIALVRQIGERQGLGDILAEGVRKAAQNIGRGAEKYAMHVKGLELAGYDPRGAKSQGLAYATAPRGGCHHTGYAEEELYNPAFDRFTIEGKESVTKTNQDKGVAFDCTGICAFPTQLGVVNMETMAKLLYAATGFAKLQSAQELMKTGERVFNLERLFNWREGMKKEEDTLPDRFLKEPLAQGKSANQTVDLNTLLARYYTLRGWNAQGRPQPKLLLELGLPVDS
jgi:aldehyde:ferredoxin oxidoreductase